VSDVVVREPLGDACKSSGMVEELARQCEASRRVDGKLDTLDARGVPLCKPNLERLRCGSVFVALRVSNCVPDPKYGDLVQPKLFHALLTQAMEMRQYDEQTVAILALVLTMLVGGSALQLAA
jgi:hypothetical protein